ncbi:hypothetical protein [Methylobacterium sp. SI9]|uniref:hypothetical protein n=1 Tax=Methylobacterium guangdongense TaxID=3138811 RepID=UPI00313D80B4
MNLWLALRRLLPLLAVLSLALTPVTAPAATAGMHASMSHGPRAAAMGAHGMAGMAHESMGHHGAVAPDRAGLDMDDMPCCPKADFAKPDAAKPDCAKGCPLMALCLGSLTSLPPAALPIPTPVGGRARVAWPDPASLSSVSGAPLPEPPRA